MPASATAGADRRPLIVGAFGMIIERLALKQLYKLDHLYGLLLTFGLALILGSLFREQYGSSGLPYAPPPELTGVSISASCFCRYRGWVIAPRSPFASRPGC